MELLRINAVLQMTGLSRSRLYHHIKTDPAFPQPVKISQRSTGFVRDEVDAWIRGRIAASREAKPEGKQRPAASREAKPEGKKRLRPYAGTEARA
jgi:prophage regulatory protein